MEAAAAVDAACNTVFNLNISEKLLDRILWHFDGLFVSLCVNNVVFYAGCQVFVKSNEFVRCFPNVGRLLFRCHVLMMVHARLIVVELNRSIHIIQIDCAPVYNVYVSYMYHSC